jgi:RNAse (barnase) inhibitor barstar
MSPRPTDDDGPVLFRIDGRKIKSVNDFYAEIGSAVNGPDGYFGRNLDALADCLRGGFGTPDDRSFAFDWEHSAVSRRALGRAFVDAVRAAFDDAEVPLTMR